jgi:hypothetical protein
MNPLKLTLLLCFFTTILCGQQEYPGYIVKLEGDTLRGRIVVMPHVIKFRQDYEKTKYLRNELADYGYYGNGSFFSKPDEAPPAPKSNIKASLVLTIGDTLRNFRVQYKSPEHIIGYFEYPKYVVYDATEGELAELITHDEEKGNISTDLIYINDYPKKGNVLLMYSERILNEGLKAYNVNYERPFTVTYRKSTIWIPLSKSAIPAAALLTLISKAEHSNGMVREVKAHASTDDWIVYKNGKIYRITNFREWRKQFDNIFEGDIGFSDYLRKRDISAFSIIEILEAYGDFIQ